MQVNELLVIPTQETLEYLATTMSGCPFDLDLTKTFVTLNISQQEMTPEPERVYKATAGSLGVWYDQSTGYSSLILPLLSESMLERVAEVRAESPSAFYGDHWFAFMVLVPDFPPQSRRHVGFTNSVSDTLATAQNAPLFFDAELVRTTDVHAVPFADYYAAQIARHYGR
jgi:hypothetical protein